VNHNADKYVVSTTPFRALRCKGNINYSGRNRHPPAAYVIQVTCQAQNRSRVSVRVRLVRAASISPSRDINQCTREGNNISINAHKPLCSTRATHLRIDPALIPLMGSLHRKQKISYRENEQKPRSNLVEVSNEVDLNLTLEDRQSLTRSDLGVDVVVHSPISRSCSGATIGQHLRTRSHVRCR